MRSSGEPVELKDIPESVDTVIAAMIGLDAVVFTENSVLCEELLMHGLMASNRWMIQALDAEWVNYG